MARGRRSNPTGARAFLVLGGAVALVAGLAAITASNDSTDFPGVAAGFGEAVVGSLMLIAGALLAGRHRVVVAAGLIGGTILVGVGSLLGIVAGAVALVAAVWAYAEPWG